MPPPDAPRPRCSRILLVLLGTLALAVAVVQPGWDAHPRPAVAGIPVLPARAAAPEQPAALDSPVVALAPTAPVGLPERHSNWVSLAFLPVSVPQGGALRVTPLYGKETIGLQVRLRF